MATSGMKPQERARVLAGLRMHNRRELVDLVKMHLSFLIDVTTDEWERIVAEVDRELEEEERDKGRTRYFTSTTSNTSTVSSQSDGHNSRLNSKFGPPKEKELASDIFGKPLSKESLKQAMILINFLNEDDNYKLEGIFRKSGTQERQQDLRYMLDNGVKVDLKANRFTPVDTSCVLKEYIQKLPEPLLTNNHFELHYELALAIKKDTPKDEIETKNEKRLKIIQLLLHLMPELNRNFFMSLMALLNRVSKAVEVTKMDALSLATIFGQHILCPRNWTPKQVSKNIDIITDAMEFLLLNYKHLFSGPFELVMDAEKKLRKYLTLGPSGDSLAASRDELSSSTAATAPDEQNDENNTVVTFCERKQSQETRTEEALAELYAQVQAMPETPAKKKLIKKFNKQNGFGTPMRVTGGKQSETTSRWKSFLPQILKPNKH